MKKIIFYTLLFNLSIIPKLYATDWQSLTQEVIDNDPRVLSAKAKLNASHADIDGAWSAYYPKVRGIGSAGISSSDDRLIRDGNKHTLGLEIEQPIPIFGHESAQVDIAEAAAKIEIATLKQTQQTVASEFLETVLRLRTAQKIWKLQQQLTELLTKQHQALQEAVAGGGAPLPQLHQAQSRLSQAQAKQQQSKSEIQYLQTRLKRLLPNEEKALPDIITEDELAQFFNKTPTEVKQAIEVATQISPILLKAQAEFDQAQAEQNSASADYWPKLSLNLQGQTGTFGESSQTSTSVFINITQPIFEGGATVAKEDSAGYRLEAARELIQQEQQMLQERIQDAWMRWKNHQQAFSFWKKATENENKAVDLIQEQVNGGVGTRITLMEAMEDRMEAQKQALEQMLERDIAWLQLFTETGSFFYQEYPSNDSKSL